MTSAFQYINSINDNKQNLMKGTANDELAEKDYVPFVTNRTLSYFQDTISLAQLMNRNHHVDNKLQYDFLLSAVRRRKRYCRWTKPENDEEVALIMATYKYNRKTAEEVLDLFTPSQIQALRLNKGGSEHEQRGGDKQSS